MTKLNNDSLVFSPTGSERSHTTRKASSRTTIIKLAAIGLLATLAIPFAAHAAEPVKAKQKAHYRRPDEPSGRTAHLQLPPGVVRPEGWVRDWCVAARKGVPGHPYDYPNPAQAIVFAKGWTGEDLPGAKATGPHGRRRPILDCGFWILD